MIVSNPKKPLNKAEEITLFEYICRKIAPYVVLACIFILLALLFAVIIRYGGAWFGTEANQFYYHMGEL